MSVRLLKPLALSAVIAVASITTADAGGRHHRHGHGHGGGNFAVGAIIGLTAGAILGSVASENRARRRSEERYAAPPPPRRYRESSSYYEDDPVYYEDRAAEPRFRNYGTNRYEDQPYEGRRYESQRNRENDRRVSYDQAPRQFTPAWYRYCERKFRSFDRDSGTYQPLEGPRRMCR